MTSRVLVTGGAGYLGSILCERLLAAGHRVTVLDNLMYGQHSLFHLCAHSAFGFVLGDARDETLLATLLRETDVIIPLAAIVGAPACDRDPWLATSVNLGAIRLAIDAARLEVLDFTKDAVTPAIANPGLMGGVKSVFRCERRRDTTVPGA